MSDVQQAADTPSPTVPRRRDRRAALYQVLATLSRIACTRRDAALLRGAFEEAVRRVVPVSTLHLRDAHARWPAIRTSAGVESLVFDVPGPAGKARGTLEATFPAGAPAGDWDFQFLGLAAHVGALVLEIDRTRIELKRADAARTAGQKVQRDGAAPLIGSTPVMHALRDRIERVAATSFTVLLEGESGVGKELVARQIHELSDRRHGPFVAVNCAALVETLLEAELFGIEERTATGVRGRRGKFEHADGGTLFLDEIGDLSPAAQAKLLRAIQEMSVERVGGQGSQRVDIRIIAATNRSLPAMVSERLFRADLFYRIGGVEVRVPSLRERRSDIEELARYFLTRLSAARRMRFSEQALQALVEYDWPGNVRELERMVERVVALCHCDVIEIEDLPAHVRRDYTEVLLPSLQRCDTLRVWACRYAKLTVDRCDGNRRRAARALGISYHTLATYLKAWQMFERAGTVQRPPHDRGADTPQADQAAAAEG
jgi:DNA-binding NtrC family response regulator